MKCAVACVVMQCSSERAQRIGETYRFHLQGLRVSQARNQHEQLNFPPVSAGLFFDHEDESDILRNIVLSSNYST
jgi:hypothetical protein